MKNEVNSNFEVYKLCKAENGLACWQNAIVNWFRINIATGEYPRIHFWHKREVLHAYLEVSGRVYSEHVTWLDASCPEISIEQLKYLYESGEIENITAPAITSQFDSAIYGMAGHKDWRPIHKIENYIPELGDRDFLLSLADKWGYQHQVELEEQFTRQSLVFNGL